MSAKVLKVILKGDEWTFSTKYLVYNEFQLDNSDPVVQEHIADAKAKLTVIPEDVEVRCTMVNK